MRSLQELSWFSPNRARHQAVSFLRNACGNLADSNTLHTHRRSVDEGCIKGAAATGAWMLLGFVQSLFGFR